MKPLIAALLAALLGQGCAATGGFVAGNSPAGATKPSCLWGGNNAEEEARCAEQRWGTRGYLIAINERAVQGLPSYEGSSPCQEHVARLEALLEDRKDLKTSPLFSCPEGSDRCHLSLLVTDAQGGQYVVDNGALFRKAGAPDGVGDFAQFVQITHGDYHVVARASEIEAPPDPDAIVTP